MPQWPHSPITHTSNLDIATLVIEINDRLSVGANATTSNYLSVVPLVPVSITANGTYSVFMPSEDFVFSGVTLKTDAGTASVSVEIDGVGVTMVGGSPIAVTTTATTTSATTNVDVPALSSVEVIISALTGAATLTVVPAVRRKA